MEAKTALKYPPVVFNGVQALAVSRGFARACVESRYRLLACAIMPDHVHLVIARSRCRVEQIILHLRGFATMRLNAESMHPLAAFSTPSGQPPSPWASCTGWVVYHNTIDDTLRSIEYVENYPLKE